MIHVIDKTYTSQNVHCDALYQNLSNIIHLSYVFDDIANPLGRGVARILDMGGNVHEACGKIFSHTHQLNAYRTREA